MALNVTLPLIFTLPFFFLAYRYYTRYIAKVFGEDDHNPTPAVSINDQKDYVPTKPLVLFGHHFAAIAGAGPIIGPTVALIYGYIPVMLWIVLGSIFIGAVHDFSALFASVRENGKSMAEVAERSMGKPGFIIFIIFAIFMLLLIGSAFIGLAAIAFTSLVPLKEMGILHSKTLIKTVTIDGIPKANLGGIAATSLIFIICVSPLIGFLLYRKGVSVIWVSLLAIIAALLSIRIGIAYPISLEHSTWMILLALYTFIAAGVPIWIIHQPRDFIDSFILYGGIMALIAGSITGGLKGLSFNAPAFNITQGAMKLGAIWPILFITVACGAISGFHALVSGGTSSKQVSRESHTKIVGYGGMLLEGIFALCVIIAVGSGFEFDRFIQVVFPIDPGVKSNPVLAFALGVGGLLERGISLPTVYGIVFGILLVAGFLATTLDASVRLTRYLLEELWAALFSKPPKILRYYFFNSFLCVSIMFILAYSNAFLIIWPIFGSANQLMAALTLLGISIWLFRKGKRCSFLILPAIFMMITTLVSLLYLLFKIYLPYHNWMLTLVDLILIGLAGGVIILSIKSFFKEGSAASIKS